MNLGPPHNGVLGLGGAGFSRSRDLRKRRGVASSKCNDATRMWSENVSCEEPRADNDYSPLCAVPSSTARALRNFEASYSQYDEATGGSTSIPQSLSRVAGCSVRDSDESIFG